MPPAPADPMRPSKLVEHVGGSHARQLGIDLSGGESARIEQWLIAAILFGARISERIAARTYREFERDGMLSLRRMTDAGSDALVAILDRSGYARYDFKTAAKLLEVGQTLARQYRGDLNVLHASAADAADLERRLKGLGKGIGEVTVNIFLRELRGIWSKANPFPSERALQAARALGFVPPNLDDPARQLQALQAAWRADRMPAADFVDFEAALVRYEAMLRGKEAPR